MANSPKPTVSKGFSRHYYALMPNKRRYRVLVWVVFLFTAAAIGIQMAYPPSRALPFAHLNGQLVGFYTENDIAGMIGKEFTAAKFELAVEGAKATQYPLTIAGAEPDAAAMTAKLTNYPFWQRFIPGSILWQRPTVSEWEVMFATTPLKEFTERLAVELSREPVNAGLAIKGGELVANSDTPGRVVTANGLAGAIKAATLQYNAATTIQVPSQVVRPAKTAADLVGVRFKAQAALARELVIEANGIKFTPTAEQKASWLRLSEDVSGNTTLSVDQPKLFDYFSAVITKQAGKPAGRTNITIQNGQEAGRQIGESGLSVNNEPLSLLVTQYLLEGVGRPPFIAEMVAVQPSIIYNNTYTATQEGLQAYIAEKAKHGAWISIQQLDGQRWSAGADHTDSVVSGSTYKLYVALYLFKQMNEGKTTWDTPILDTNTTTCFDRMTIASTNPCAEEWLRQFGRDTVNDYLYGVGFSRATTFTHPEASHTSAADLTKFMIGLEDGTLISGAQRERLLHSLATHPYRYGIPKGSAGQVWDKVGFLWDYVNDTAIVHHPKGKYVMTILTKGQSYGAIASMTREIERIMYP